jgi:hypothetical protein
MDDPVFARACIARATMLVRMALESCGRTPMSISPSRHWPDPGTVDHTPVYPREVVRRALELSAVAIIMAHDHPSGDPTPSRANIDMTRQIVDIARPLGSLEPDPIIVGSNGHASFTGLRLI